MTRFAALFVSLVLLFAAGSLRAQSARDAADAALSALGSGAIVLIRHALAPGTGDPPGFTPNDCATQRVLNDEGRAQAQALGRRLGEHLRRSRLSVDALWTSSWCRTRETAELIGLGTPRDQPSFDSILFNRSRAEALTANARRMLLDWKGEGILVVVTHQLNITGLTGVYPQSGEAIVLKAAGDKLEVVGRIAPGS